MMNSRFGALVGVCLWLGSWGARAATAADAGETMFFAFDDHAIPRRSNLKVTLVQAEKHPENPVLRCGPPGSPDYGHAILYGSVLRIDGKFRMWYLGMSQRQLERGQAPGWWRPMCYAESEDGIHWTKPDLGLVDFNGSKQNNVCLIESDLFSLSRVNDFLTVIHEPEDPDPARRYKAAFIAHLPFEEVKGGRSRIGPDEKRWAAIVCATSADGLRWKVVGDRPMNAGGERFEVSGLYHFGGMYHITGQLISPWTSMLDGRDIGRVMLEFRSPDFDHWSLVPTLAFARPGQLLAEPLKGQQTHMGAGMWNRGNVMIGLYGQWQDGPAEKPKGASHLWGTRIDLGLILSNDGAHFREPVPDFKVIARGAEGTWDSICLLQGHAFANVGDKTYLWYSHWDCESQFRSQEIGLATLRRDGFGYLSRRLPAEKAECITDWVSIGHAASALKINLEGASPAAPLIVELLDAQDRPLPGYSGAGAAQITQSGTQVQVLWPQSGKADLPQGQRVAIRVVFPDNSDARVYTLAVHSAGPARP